MTLNFLLGGVRLARIGQFDSLVFAIFLIAESKHFQEENGNDIC